MKVVHVIRRSGDDRAWALVRQHMVSGAAAGVLLVQEAAASEAGAGGSPFPAGVSVVRLHAEAPIEDYRQALRELLAARLVISW